MHAAEPTLAMSSMMGPDPPASGKIWLWLLLRSVLLPQPAAVVDAVIAALHECYDHACSSLGAHLQSCNISS